MTSRSFSVLAVLVILLCTLQWSGAWKQMIISTANVCTKFHVAHGEASRNMDSTAIAVNLLNVSGTAVDCVEPRTAYTRKLLIFSHHNIIIICRSESHSMYC